MTSLPLSYKRFLEQGQKICTDSRKIIEDSLFVALKGPNFNGNQYAIQALEQGAAYAIVDEHIGNDPRIIYVENCLVELQNMARLHRRLLKPKIIAITGSNGKTTTKELSYAIFSKALNVIATKGNLNNHIGVPLTLLQITRDTDLALVEMGANKPGDIQELCLIAEPDAGLITSIGKAHLEGFGSPEGVVQTKMELFRFLDQNEGICFYNVNDPRLHALYNKEQHHVAYGDDSANLDYYGEPVRYYPDIELYFNTPEKRLIVHSSLFGKYNYNNILGACTLASYFGIDPVTIQAGIESYVPENMRSQILDIKGATVLLDAYNANPSSMKEALDAFQEMPYSEKWVLLGEMAELGNYAEKEHDELVNEVKSKAFKEKIFIGRYYQKFENDRDVKVFSNCEECHSWLKEHWPNHAALLIKGSRSAALERLIH